MKKHVIQFDVPLLPIGEYARRTGQSVRDVRYQCANGHLPAVKVGKYWHVNVAKLTENALEKEGWV